MTTASPSSGAPQDLPELPDLPQPDVYDPGRFGVAWVGVKVIKYAQDYARAAILADRAARQEAVPAGFWLAPIEPDEEMVDAVRNADLDIYWGYYADGKPSGGDDVFRLMRDDWLSRHPATRAQQAESDHLASLFESLDVDKSQPGYHWRKGWNAALRRVQGYLPSWLKAADRPVAVENDTARLDWLECRCCDVSRLGDKARTIRISWNNGADHVDVGPFTHPNWRAALDAARSVQDAYIPRYKPNEDCS